jgi:amino acid permease
MFGKMLDVTNTRSTTDAVWFYLTSLVLLVGVSTVLGHVLGMVGVVDTVGSFFDGGHIHTLIGTGFVLVLSSLILTGRKLTSDLFSILLVGISVYLSYTTSVMLGMIPVALLTTLPSTK